MNKYFLFFLSLILLSGCQLFSTSESPITNLNDIPKSEDAIQDAPDYENLEERIFVSNELGISFKIPRHIKNCAEEVWDANGDDGPGDFVGQGWRTEIVCDEYRLYFRADSRDFKCYEFCPYSKYPDSDKFRYSNYQFKIGEREPITIFAMDDDWELGGYGLNLGAYYPLHGDRYDTFRITMYLTSDQGSINDKAVYNEYATRIINKDLPEGELKRVEDFERMLLSIQGE